MRVGADIRIPLEAMARVQLNALRSALRFPNPAYQRSLTRTGRAPYGIPEFIDLARMEGTDLVAPRGALDVVRGVLGGVRWTDTSPSFEPLSIALHTPMRDYQSAAVDELVAAPTGILIAPTGGGKQMMIAGVIARLRQPALILTPTIEQVRQLADTCRRALGVEPGIIGGGKRSIGAEVTIATPQSAVKMLDDLAQRFGALLADEAHHAGATTDRRILEAIAARYRYGFTATAERTDGLWPIVCMYFGPIRTVVDRAALETDGYLLRPDYVRVQTAFVGPYGSSNDWQPLLDLLVNDDARTEQVADLVSKECGAGDVGLVLTGRVEHAKRLGDALAARQLRVQVVTGAMSQKTRARAIDAARSGQLDVLVATTLADEGLDVPLLAKLFLTFPARAKSRFVQRIGRVLRPHSDKRPPVVFDFVDSRVRLLNWQATKRAESFREVFGVAA